MTKHDNVSQEGIMKATEFVKQHGIEKARECIEDANDYGGFWVNAKTLELSNLIPSYDAVSIPSIQRLVESHELVIVWRMPEAWSGDYDGDVNGLEGAKMYLDMYGNYELVGDELERFKQAIADVEACQ